MEYRQMHIPVSQNRRPGTKATMTSITVHNTANPTSTALNERNWLVNPYNNRTASWHIAIDEKMAVEAIPLNEVAWHTGTREGNSTSIGIELCESGDQKKVWSNAVTLIASMLNERGWGVDRVRTHKSWSGKECPRLILPRWPEFIADIKVELLKLQAPAPAPSPDVSPWAVDARKWAMEKGITDGNDPKGAVTREQVWVMLHRAMGG